MSPCTDGSAVCDDLMARVFSALLILSLCASLLAIERAPLADYKMRRDRLAEKAKGGYILLWSAPEKELVEYLQEPDFFYLTGFDESGAVLVIDATSARTQDYLFIKPTDPSQEQWTGPRTAPGRDAQARLGISHVQSVDELAGFLKKLPPTAVFYGLQHDFQEIRSLLPAAQPKDIGEEIDALRQVKSAHEVSLLEKAVQITLKAQTAAARTILPGAMEYEVEAALEFEFRRNGAERPGFPSIVGSGPLSTILHYDKNTRQMQAGEVVVVDIGAGYSGYSADVTRTYPVSGKFSPRQREIYQIVLEAQKAAIAEVKPGATFASIHAAAYDYIRSKGYAKYFIHGTSHHIGLEVHDAGKTARPLEANMVITVEPGIYLPAEGFGVRIEDDVLVTPSGNRVLSTFAKEADEIESLVQRKPKP